MRTLLPICLVFAVGCLGRGTPTDSGSDSTPSDDTGGGDDTGGDTTAPDEGTCAWSLYDMEMVSIQPGTFVMGSPPDEPGRDPDEDPVEVTLTHTFEVAATEITLAQWRSCMGYEPTGNEPAPICDDCPVGTVTWWEVASYANALSREAGYTECYSCEEGNGVEVCETAMNPYTCDGYRMLTQAEWEYAARAGTDEAYNPDGGASIVVEEDLRSCGDVILSNGASLNDYAWFCGNTGDSETSQPLAVAGKLPNDWGLYDMHGNSWEWVNDWAWENRDGPLTDPAGPEGGAMKLRRGSSIWGTPERMRLGLRVQYEAKLGEFHIGSRLGRITD